MDFSHCFEELHEECGVLGIYGVDKAPRHAFLGLQALQHRGQQACGLAVTGPDWGLLVHKGAGLVKDVFPETALAGLHGDTCIGHVRYPTTEVGGMENIQPFRMSCKAGTFALAHNGNIVNAGGIKARLETLGHLFHSTSDSELFAHLIKKDRSDDHRIYNIMDALNILEGAFSMIVMTPNRLYVCRDKYGFHPLSVARLGDGWVVASETCAFDAVGATFERDVEPGEVLSIDHHGLRSNH